MLRLFGLFFSRIKQLLGITDKFIINDEFRECLDYLENSSGNLFLTGKAGTGKSTLIRYWREHTKKSVAVLAPTGISALNIGGQTIHSFFKFPPHLIDKKAVKDHVDSPLYTGIDTLILDEISMVRADLLDGVDSFMRRHGRDKNLPFGGVQVVLVGDLYQLPPIVTKEESEVFRKIYDTPYFFSSNVFKTTNFKIIELTLVFRQKKGEFIELLNKVRTGRADTSVLNPINDRLSKKKSDEYITLTTTNSVAEGINESKLDSLKHPLFTYKAEIEGDFPTEDKNLPVPLSLRLKKGARVMFVKNDKAGRWVNGSLGWVDGLDKDWVKVRISDDHRDEVVNVPIGEWENIKYEYDDEAQEVKIVVLGKLRQYPLRLAWAVTIHKSQGMTFSKVRIDFTKSPFAHGQTYVALSRCRTLEGLALTRKIWPNDILIDPKIAEFYKTLDKNLNATS